MIGLFQYRLGALRPADAHTIEMCGRFKQGEVLKAEPKRMRNYKQICLWWALVGVLAEHADWCASKEDASDWLKISIGHFNLIRSPDGKEWARPKSIAYGNCEQTEFDQLLNAAIKVVCEKIIPGTNNEVLARELEAMVMPASSESQKPTVAKSVSNCISDMPGNDADDDWRTIANDIMALIDDAPNRGRLEEIDAIHERALIAMKTCVFDLYNRVMDAMEQRRLEFDRKNGAAESPEPARLKTGVG